MRRTGLVAVLLSCAVIRCPCSTDADALPETDADALLREARAAANRGDATSADALLQSAAKSDAHAAEALFLRGNVHAFLTRQLAEAEQFYKQSLHLNSSRWEPSYFLGKMLSGQQRWAEAVEALSAAAALAPTNAAVLQELGSAHGMIGAPSSWDAASSALIRAAALAHGT